MSNLDWEEEHERFMADVYPRTMTAAKRAFNGWHSPKQADAIQECLAKMWDSWSRCLKIGKNPEPMTSAMIKFAVLWVRYDRKIGGRSRKPDVYDYRSGFSRQMLSDQGHATPSNRSSAENPWIEWALSDGDDPADVVMALEATGLSFADYYAA